MSPRSQVRYIVWNQNGPYSPKVTHPNRDEARKAARGMAGHYPGETFFVCAAVDSFVKADVQHIDLAKKEDGDDIPF